MIKIKELAILKAQNQKLLAAIAKPIQNKKP
jgi:hypothetical protein